MIIDNLTNIILTNIENECDKCIVNDATQFTQKLSNIYSVSNPTTSYDFIDNNSTLKFHIKNTQTKLLQTLGFPHINNSDVNNIYNKLDNIKDNKIALNQTVQIEHELTTEITNEISKEFLKYFNFKTDMSNVDEFKIGINSAGKIIFYVQNESEDDKNKEHVLSNNVIVINQNDARYINHSQHTNGRLFIIPIDNTYQIITPHNYRALENEYAISLLKCCNTLNDINNDDDFICLNMLAFKFTTSYKLIYLICFLDSLFIKYNYKMFAILVTALKHAIYQKYKSDEVIPHNIQTLLCYIINSEYNKIESCITSLKLLIIKKYFNYDDKFINYFINVTIGKYSNPYNEYTYVMMNISEFDIALFEKIISRN